MAEEEKIMIIVRTKSKGLSTENRKEKIIENVVIISQILNI